MNPEQPNDIQRVLAELDARLGRISAEVAEVRAGLAALGGRTGTAAEGQPQEHLAETGRMPEEQRQGGHGDSMWRPGGPPGTSVPGQTGGPWRSTQVPSGLKTGPWRPGQALGQPEPWRAGTAHGQPEPWRAGPAPAQGLPQPWRPGQDQLQPDPSHEHHPRRPRVGAATIIAAIGGAVMLAGIAFLLVVAIQAGLFPPLARVIGAAALAVILVALGLWLQMRHEPTRDRPVNPGALALVGTGLAAGMLDVIASTVLYQWVPVPAAYMFVGGLALAGMALAQRWSSAVLAGLVTAGTLALAPLISSGIELPIFYVIVGIAAAVLAAELGVVVRFVWSVPPAFMLSGFLATSGTIGQSDQIALIAAALVFAAASAGVAWYDTFRGSPGAEYAALVVVPGAVPLLVLPTVDLLRPGWPIGLLLAAAYLVMAVLLGRTRVPGEGGYGGAEGESERAADPGGYPEELPAPGRRSGMLLAAVAGSVGSVLLVAAWAELGGPAATGLALTLTAIAYALVATQLVRRWLEWAARILTGLALLVYLTVNQPQLALVERLAVRDFSYVDVVASFAIGVLAVAVIRWVGRRNPGSAARVTMGGVVVALVALSVMIVAAGVVIGDLGGYPRNGFLVAHLVVTVLWIVCAAWLVLAARPRLADARRLGFVLGGLALSKLLLLDLATLPGLFRVISFIVVGAVMLAVAVRYRKDTEPSGSGSPT